MKIFYFLIIIIIIIAMFLLYSSNNVYGCQLLAANYTASEIQKDIIFSMISAADYQINNALNPFFSFYMSKSIQGAIETLGNLDSILDEIIQFQPTDELEQAKNYLQVSIESLKQADLFDAKSGIGMLNSTISSITREVC